MVFMPLSLSLSDFGFTSLRILTLLMLETEPFELDLDLDFETDLDFDLDLDLDELVCLERGLLLRDRGDLARLLLDARDDREDAEELLLLLLLELEERERLPDFGLELADLLLFLSILAELSSSESSLIRLKSMSTSLSLSSAIFFTNRIQSYYLQETFVLFCYYVWIEKKFPLLFFHSMLFLLLQLHAAIPTDPQHLQLARDDYTDWSYHIRDIY